jgi:LmbE family N-acetylglucosaminyl deacetylase
MIPAVTAWGSPGKQRVLVVAPHPDDEVAGCGGTIILHVRAGDQVTVLHVTDGRRSRALGLGPEAMARRRHQEARESLAALGVERWTWLGLPGEWTDRDFVVALERLLPQVRPHVIYLPSRIDFHPEHYRVARAAAPVVRRLGGESIAVRVYQVQVPLTRVLVNLVAPIEAAVPDVLRAYGRYVSQAGSLRSTLRMKAYAARSHGLAGMAEEFWEMSGAAYAALHAQEPARALVDTFRGLRLPALTDPLGFLRGRRERRRLLRLATVAEDASTHAMSATAPQAHTRRRARAGGTEAGADEQP